ncbi:hypothetical protein DPMN_088872 [Dreissena polymorpha]|uniref:Uncharacterized protein n=1 Tax=Dreissena polymorpha TaxID=45954 RepID=A0A9D4QWW8_DREPO|nr:hypothetical protein DPMN_088872 [Dreissena polymorpha]
MKEFFRIYKDRFPMLGVILEGWYSDTRFDCYDNLQVRRSAHNLFCLMRVRIVSKFEASSYGILTKNTSVESVLN